MLLRVSEAIYPQPGERHEYRLSDGSSVVECPALPAVSRLRFYDNRNHWILNKTVQASMKAAVNQHKKRWGVSHGQR